MKKSSLVNTRLISLIFLITLTIYSSFTDLLKIYDAYTHIFLATHYLLYWGQIFDPRWYLGFNISTYLPLYHESIALYSFFVGLDNAFRVSLFLGSLLLIYSLHRYYSLFFSNGVSRLSLYLLLSVPSIYSFFFLFGQLPQLLSISLSLMSIYYLDRYTREGVKYALAFSIVFLTASLIAHTLTLIVYLPLAGGYIISRFIDREYNKKLFLGLIVVWLISILLSLPIIYLHISSLSPQTEIPHGSRNPLGNLNNFLFFSMNIYGLLIILIPVSLIYLFKDYKEEKNVIIYALVMIFYLIIGLGYTTPIPEIIFGSWSRWLTYDRFSLIASLLSPPLVIRIIKRFRSSFFTILILVMFVSSLASVEYSRRLIFPIQDINIEAVASVVDERVPDGYSYITLGFGIPSLSKLSIYMKLPSIDGGYPTARAHLKFLKESGIESLDSAKLYSKGLDVLNYVLSHKDSLGLYLVLTADDYYDTLLYRYDYIPIYVLRSGRKVIIWVSETPVNKIYLNSDMNMSNPLTLYWHILPIIILFLLVFIFIHSIIYEHGNIYVTKLFVNKLF